jgi:hypothetical protein
MVLLLTTLQGRIDMHAGQDHVAIPVTILGDKLV